MSLPRLSLIAITTLLAFSAQAEDEQRWYQTEIVIFEKTSLADAKQEVWPENPGSPLLRGIATLNSPPAGFEIRDRSELELGGAKTHLARSGRYKPILHFAWRQPGLAKAIAIPMRIQGGLRYVASMPVADPEQNNINDTQAAPGGAITSGLSGSDNTTTLFAPREVSQIDGTLKLVLGRYLHLHTDLLYRRMVPDSALQTSGIAPSSNATGQMGIGSKVMSFRMRQQRRMRSKELHYIDHPLFGILVKVVPVTPPETAG